MLKMNTKKARENLRGYILKYFDPSDYEGYPDEFTGNMNDFNDVKSTLLKFFVPNIARGERFARVNMKNFMPGLQGCLLLLIAAIFIIGLPLTISVISWKKRPKSGQNSPNATRKIASRILFTAS